MRFVVLSLTIVFNVVFGDTDFLINTRGCKIPNFPVFSEEANKDYKSQEYTKCTELDLLTFTTVKNNIAYLHINNTRKVLYTSGGKIDCCYSYVRRNGSLDEPDVGIRKSNCRRFNKTVQLEENTVMVQCYSNKTLVYENVHNPIVISIPVKKKLNLNFTNDANEAIISVLFVVIDGISRLNLERTMPNTRNFLLSNEFIEFVGYNKIDSNTFPNFMAFLTGLNLKQSNETCKPLQTGKLDECPMIWYDFRNLGYVTAYAEDWSNITTFNFGGKKGFKYPPVDYYFKTYVEAFETLNITKKDTMPYCAGPETAGERILNLAKYFSITFKNKPSFGIFWMNSFSHNNINSPSGMDKKVKEFFQELQQNGIFDESIVIFLSDHGVRYGAFPQTIQGWYEHRLPMNLISLPKWFKRDYSSKYSNFKKNANKLTSPYDLYMTLQDILYMSVSSHNMSTSKACPKCLSLFSEISENRLCKDAGIPKEWCTCRD